MSTVKSKKLQVGTDATSSNNFTIYQPATPDGTLRIGVDNADSPTEVGQFNANGYVATKAPAFKAYASATHNPSLNTWTKIQFDSEEFDTNSNFDTSTYRFTPTVAGYYYITAKLRGALSTSVSTMYVSLYDGTGHEVGFRSLVNNLNQQIMETTALRYFNGSTDYIEAYCNFQGSGTATVYGNGTFYSSSTFQGILIKAV